MHYNAVACTLAQHMDVTCTCCGFAARGACLFEVVRDRGRVNKVFDDSRGASHEEER